MTVRVIYKSGQVQDFCASPEVELGAFLRMAERVGGKIKTLEFP